MSDAVEAQSRLDEAVRQQRALRDARDAAIRAARDSGWTYDELIARLGITSAVIRNASQQAI